jgi:hypothetical protein
MKKPNLFKRFIMSVVYLWRRVMDVKFNPLKYVPDASLQAYFMVVLFTLWSVSFGLIATHYLGWRTGEKWLEEWKQENSRYSLLMNRLKKENLVRWELNKEA